MNAFNSNERFLFISLIFLKKRKYNNKNRDISDITSIGRYAISTVVSYTVESSIDF